MFSPIATDSNSRRDAVEAAIVKARNGSEVNSSADYKQDRRSIC